MATKPTELKKLAAGHTRWVKKAKASGRKFVTCRCPHCRGEIELLRPRPGERDYTSGCRCCHCGELFAYRTCADGGVTSIPL